MATIRVLCLHGLGDNAEIFKAQTGRSQGPFPLLFSANTTPKKPLSSIFCQSATLSSSSTALTSAIRSTHQWRASFQVHTDAGTRHPV